MLSKKRWMMNFLCVCERASKQETSEEQQIWTTYNNAFELIYAFRGFFLLKKKNNKFRRNIFKKRIVFFHPSIRVYASVFFNAVYTEKARTCRTAAEKSFILWAYHNYVDINFIHWFLFKKVRFWSFLFWPGVLVYRIIIIIILILMRQPNNLCMACKRTHKNKIMTGLN
jgi:hypothetical protein